MEYEILTRSLKDSAAHSKLKLLKEGETFGVEKPGGEKRIHIGSISEEKRWDSFFFPNGEQVCIMAVSKIDLIKYMLEAKEEFFNPRQSYRLNISDFYDDLYKQTLDIPQETFSVCFEKNTDNSRYYLSRPSKNEFFKNYNYINDICLPIVTQYVFLRVKDGDSYIFYLKPEFKPDFTIPNSIETNSIHRNIIQHTGNTSFTPLLTALRTKPFVLLAGISGTGKSRIVRELAKASVTEELQRKYDPTSVANGFNRWKLHKPANFELIQVKPNWHNSLEVVGYKSNIGGAHYEFTPFVEFVARAWQNQNVPFFLCLDEMNLAPVEQYFAEFLSAIESRSFENDEYETDPIIKPFKEFGGDVCNEMLNHLVGAVNAANVVPNSPEAKLVERFRTKGLTLPKNLFVLGTVNMDETTFSFSRKVLDRAMSIVMNEVDYDKFFLGESESTFAEMDDNMRSYLVNRPIRGLDVIEQNDSDGVKNYLSDVNVVLNNTPFKLGYRAANEALLYVSAARQLNQEVDINAVLDEFTLMKILSRIEGDKRSIGNKLSELLTVVTESYPKSHAKLADMAQTLQTQQFVSYWA